MEKSFSELLRASFKSADTEEWLDIYFTRPIGLAFALLWARLGVHPNTITILSMFLGIGAGWMFSHTDLWHNIAGIVLMMFANFCDSTDGQLARLTGRKTLIGGCSTEWPATYGSLRYIWASYSVFGTTTCLSSM